MKVLPLQGSCARLSERKKRTDDLKTTNIVLCVKSCFPFHKIKKNRNSVLLTSCHSIKIFVHSISLIDSFTFLANNNNAYYV